MKKIICIIIMFVCFMYSLNLINAQVIGENYNVSIINKCYGNVTIRIVNHDIQSPARFVNCTLSEGLWYCKCKNPTIIYMATMNNTPGEYDIYIQYYDAPFKPGNSSTVNVYNEVNKRNLAITNIRFDMYKKQEDDEIVQIKTSMFGYVFGFGVAIIIFIIIIYLLAKAWGKISKTDIDDVFEDKKKK